MQRHASSVALRGIRQIPIQSALSPLPGLAQLTVPAYLCSLSSSLPSITSSVSGPSTLINLRSFAAEACRVEDRQSAAEALFKHRDSFPATVHQSVAHPFFAKAYYVGKRQHISHRWLMRASLHCNNHEHDRLALCRKCHQPRTTYKACKQNGLLHIRGKGHGLDMCCTWHKQQAH